MVNGCYKSQIVTTFCGDRTGEIIYQTADGKCWKDADPWDVIHRPTGFSFAYRSGNTVFTKCCDSS